MIHKHMKLVNQVLKIFDTISGEEAFSVDPYLNIPANKKYQEKGWAIYSANREKMAVVCRFGKTEYIVVYTGLSQKDFSTHHVPNSETYWDRKMFVGNDVKEAAEYIFEFLKS